MTDDDTLQGRLAALRRMIGNGEQRGDLLIALDACEAASRGPTRVEFIATIRAFATETREAIDSLECELERCASALLPTDGAVRVADAPVKTDVAVLAEQYNMLRAELDAANATIAELRKSLVCPICLGLPVDDFVLCACGATNTGRASGGIVEAFKSAHEAWAREKVRADSADAVIEGYGENEPPIVKGAMDAQAAAERDVFALRNELAKSMATNASQSDSIRVLRRDLTALDELLLDRRNEIESLSLQAEQDQETAGLLCNVCDAAFGDPQRAEAHGYAGILERVRELMANEATIVNLRDALSSLQVEYDAYRRGAERQHESLRDQLTVANCDAAPDEPVERRDDWPHVHHVEAVYLGCDRCRCGATRQWTRDTGGGFMPLAWVELSPVPRTELGRKLIAARVAYIAAGGPLLSADEINEQLARAPAPATTLEAQLAEAQEALRPLVSKAIDLRGAIAARDGKAGT